MISRESLARFGDSSPSDEKLEVTPGFDMEAFMAKHGFEVIQRKPWQSHPGALIYEIRECPINVMHQNGSAAFALADGKPGFRCQHNRCLGRTIKHVFALYPPAGSAQVTVTAWPELIRLDRNAPDPIPADCLPGWLGEMAQAAADSTETPFDLAALLSIAAASSCVAGKVEVSPEPGYTEPLNIYVSPGMESGNRKTAVFNRLLAPLAEWSLGNRAYRT